MARILVAEDDRNNRLAIELHLRLRGYDVRVVPGGAELLELARQQPPDLCILDLMMPLMDGFELCRRLRAEGMEPTLPILALTALDVDRYHEQAVAAGFDGYVEKPYSLHELDQRIESLLAGSRAA